MLAFISGDDAWAAEREVVKLAAALATDGASAEIWRLKGSEAVADLGTLGARVATAPLFGGGTLAVIDEPEPLLRSTTGRELVVAAMERIAPGNGLAFVALDDPKNRRRPAALDKLQQAVSERNGRVISVQAPTRDRMQSFIRDRAGELGVEMDPAAIRLLSERVGAWVRENDIDRRRQAQIAAAEVEKLGLFRPGGRVGEEDVRALVPEAVPGSAWGFLDAVGSRRTAEAAGLLALLLAGGEPPLPALMGQLHRRLRSLIEIREHLDSGASASALPRILKMKSFRAEKLAGQAGAWSAEDLEGALEALFELDVTIKGLDGVSASDAERELALELWLVERVRRS